MNKAELEKKLTPKEKLFCLFYATKRDFFGNGTKSYGEAYNKDMSDPKKNSVARVEAGRMLAKPHISKYIKILMEETLMSDKHMDIELGKIIYNYTEKTMDRIVAIKEVNRVKNRGNKTDLNHTGNVTVVCKQFLPGEK